MNELFLPAAIGALATCAAASVLLILRRWRPGTASAKRLHMRLPRLLWIATPVATLIEPMVPCLLTPTAARRAARELESLGLMPALTVERWLALRIAEGVVLGALALLFGLGPLLAGLALLAGHLHGAAWLRRERATQHQSVARELPAWLDLMTVCVEAGATLTSGLRVIVAQAPPGPLRDYFERVLREIRGGRPRAQAFSHVAEIYGIESLGTLASALAHAEGSGMSLGQVLRAQAVQRTAERFARAEKLAMQAPVKLLGPLILCIFPCTFIVIAVPIAVRLKEALGA